MPDFDTIIIGSGAGGLSAALCLARAGQRVLVLEKHEVPGGWCHSFTLGGQRFSPGVHYIGQLDAGGATNDLYSALGIANDLTFFRMNPKAYEHCWIGEERIDLPADIRELSESLSRRFPQERAGIQKYLQLVRTVNTQLQLIPKMQGFWDNITIPFRTAQLGKYGLFSLKRVIDWYLKDPLLKGVLNLQCGDHGLPPARASFPLHCAVMGHYLHGGFYPSGGGGAIVKAFTTAIKKHGGQIRTSQGVRRILLENSKKKYRAVGVELESGEQLTATTVLSNADPAQTFRLVGHEHISEKLRRKLARTRYSVTSLMLFLTVDMDVRQAGIDSGNIWMLNQADLDRLFDDMQTTDLLAGSEFPAIFLSCTTIKDPPSYNGRHHNLEVVTFINYEAFLPYETSGNYHTPAYLEFKNKLTEKMLNSVEKALPGMRQHIVQAELGTPLTNEYYVNTTHGNVYGTEKTFRQTGPFSFHNRSEIENLYLCGASILSHGVAGASYSGVQTAAAILGCGMRDLLQPIENQQVRVYEAEDPNTWPDWVNAKMQDRQRRLHSSTSEAE